MYTSINFKTKKAFREAVESGRNVEIYQPGPFGGGEVKDGTYAIEGPYYPAPHSWCATATVQNGKVVKVK